MLVSIVERFHEKGERDVDRFARWDSAIRRLRSDGESGALPAPPELRDYLADLPVEQRPDALQDLIAEHLRLAWKSGRGTRLETYFTEFAADFPEWASPETVPADLVEDEFLARYQHPHGDTPAPDDYRKRFLARIDVESALERRFFDGGRFVKLSKRGAGAMGEVWEVFDTRTRERIAVKEPRAGAGVPRQLAGEAAVTAGLAHAGIVHLEERRRNDGIPFFAMRLVDGQTLSSCIGNYHRPPSDRTSRQQHLRLRALLESFVSICDVVASAHAGGVLHCDLKPGNVIVEAPGTAAILDWGMARRIAPTNEASGGIPADTLAGTPESMPPEQIEGIADVRSDVFGLGAVLYEILTGGPPHAWPFGARPADWVDIVRHGAIPRPRRVNVKTPRPLDAICMRALARNPDERYQSVDELAADVRRYLERTPVWVRILRLVRGRGNS